MISSLDGITLPQSAYDLEYMRYDVDDCKAEESDHKSQTGVHNVIIF